MPTPWSTPLDAGWIGETPAVAALDLCLSRCRYREGWRYNSCRTTLRRAGRSALCSRGGRSPRTCHITNQDGIHKNIEYRIRFVQVSSVVVASGIVLYAVVSNKTMPYHILALPARVAYRWPRARTVMPRHSTRVSYRLSINIVCCRMASNAIVPYSIAETFIVDNVPAHAAKVVAGLAPFTSLHITP